MRMPWNKWYPSDWLSDIAIAKASLAARGLWAEAVNAMLASNSYCLEGFPAELARVLRCSESELLAALPNLKDSMVADVTLRENGRVTLISRRLLREHKSREGSRLRSQRFRNKLERNAEVPSASVSASETAVRKGKESEKGETCDAMALQSAIAAHYKRGSARWNYDEEAALAAVARRPDVLKEWTEIKSFYAKPKAYPRQSTLALLTNWAGEVDRARGYKPPDDRNELSPEEAYRQSL